MALHLVGQTIDAKRAFLSAQSGAWVNLVRGVYVDADDDIAAVTLDHAVRIAHYLYPRAYLSAASAILLGPTADGRLFLGGRRNQRTRLRSLEIIQTEAPPHPSIVPVIVGDDLGELRLNASSPRQRFLEAFRMRSAHASAVSDEMRAQMASRLVEEYRTAQDSADALWALARENGWYREGEATERYLKGHRGAAPVNKALLDLIVAWHGRSIGHIRHDGYEWRWSPDTRPGPPLVRETTPGKLPPFIESLLPEGWLASVLRQDDQRKALRIGKRYMSNIAIVGSRKDLATLPADVLHGRLEEFQRRGAFTGSYRGPGRGELEDGFERNLAQIFEHSETPRLSGIQIKAPMFLDDQGVLRPAITEPFTHVLKPAGKGGFGALPIVEWLCLELARATGFETPAIALVPMTEDMPPALLVERFDIRLDRADRRMLALEDLCSVLDLPASAKYDGSIERVARGLRPLSTNPAADLEILFRRALFAWLIADGDMHLKNLALLKTAKPGRRTFESVRLAPVYDAVTTRVFPGLGTDLMALPLNGKKNRLAPRDFEQLARTIDLPLGRAAILAREVAQRASRDIGKIQLPRFARSYERAAILDKIKDIVRDRAEAFI